MAGPTALELLLVLSLGALWASGLATRAAGAALLVVALARWLPSGARKEGGPKLDTAKRERAVSGGGESLFGTFVPSTGLLEFSKGYVHVVENDNCTCHCHVLYRPTDDPDRDASGAHRHSAHFKGKKRLWEIRWQIRVKRVPRRPLVFGLELSQYVPVSGWARRIQEMTVSTLRSVVGKDLYHSCGDNPSSVQGECERPVFVMPLWAFDQLIVSEPGEEPDIRDIESLGVLRTSNRAAFIRQLSNLELQPDKVYTFAFWCISRFVDVVNWQMLGVVPGGVSFNTFCGKPPVSIVIYELDEEERANARGGKEQRHLPSRKRYYFNMALWSTKDPPSEHALRALLPEVPSSDTEFDRQVSPWKGNSGWCCWR